MTGFEMAIIAALQAESMRKQHVGGKIARKEQEAAANKAEDLSKEQEEKRLAIQHAQSAKDRMVQKDTIIKKNPFKKKGNLRSQFTIGSSGGSGSGVNY